MLVSMTEEPHYSKSLGKYKELDLQLVKTGIEPGLFHNCVKSLSFILECTDLSIAFK